jgi:16S rRNA (guanine1207-N2)-methyltransferase
VLHPKADPAALAARWWGPLEGLRVLVTDVPDAAAAARLDPDRAAFRWFCTDWPTHQALEGAGYPSTFGPWLPEGIHAEAALVFLPRGRERIHMTLAMVAGALPAGAPLWVVGAKGGGIESAGAELERLAIPEGVEAGRHARLLMARTRPPVATHLDDHLTTWVLTRGGGELAVASLPGVFSHGRLDDGTRLLLDTVPCLPGPLLDVGCGAGIIGAWYGSRGGSPVTLVDVDALAVESARRTLALNQVPGSVEAGDVFPAEGTFASIVSNPPFHRGSATDDRVTATLVAGARTRLAPDGTLTLVCNRFLPVPDRLDGAFGHHRVLADDGRYRVYRASRT